MVRFLHTYGIKCVIILIFTSRRWYRCHDCVKLWNLSVSQKSKFRIWKWKLQIILINITKAMLWAVYTCLFFRLFFKFSCGITGYSLVKLGWMFGIFRAISIALCLLWSRSSLSELWDQIRIMFSGWNNLLKQNPIISTLKTKDRITMGDIARF